MSHASPAVLVVDDEPQIRSSLAALVTDAGLSVLTAADMHAARALLDAHAEIGVIVADLHLPDGDGLALAAGAAGGGADGRRRELVVMSGNGDKDEAIRALRLGALDFLEKPFASGAFVAAVLRAAERRQRAANDERLSDDLAEQREMVALLRDQLAHAYAESLQCLVEASFQHDHETGAHTRRIGLYARFLARALGLDALEQARIELAARLHDVGKIGIPDAILRKPGALNATEWTVMRRHTEIGEAILTRSRTNGSLKLAAEIAGGHHERWDGSGYPRGLAGEAIPLGARITAIGDVYDALRSERPYKTPLSHDAAVATILHGDNRTCPEHFDPTLLGIFSQQHPLFAEIFARLQEDRPAEPAEPAEPATEARLAAT